MKRYFLFLIAIVITISCLAQTKTKYIITKNEKDLIPEGIAIDKKTGTIFVSSINRNKIIAIDKNGNHQDFITTGQDGLLEGLGMKVDEKRNWLWVASNKREGKKFIAQIHAFDLKTRSKQQYYSLTDTVFRLFNDLIIDGEKVYFTDTYYGAVYEINPTTQKMNLLIREEQFKYPNGIEIDEKNKYLYIATYHSGLMVYDKNSKQLNKLTGYKDSLAFGLDGLVYWNNSLIGVFNNSKDRSNHCIVQYMLDENGTKIVAEKIIDRGNEWFYEPTTATISGNKLYVLANSHLGFFNANKESTAGIEDKLKPVVVIVYELK